MWDRIPREGGNGLKLTDGFKLTARRVPEDASQAAALPMTHIWQGAVQFDQDLRQRQLEVAQNAKKKADEQSLATVTDLSTNEPQTGRAASAWWSGGAKKGISTSTDRRVSFLLGSNHNQADASPTGYIAQGNRAKAVSSTPARLGTVVDVLA
jgi:hypothetical protein